VINSRMQRKEYLRRRDFEIGAVLSRAVGPVIVLGLWLLIGFEVHAFYTVALPWFAFGKPLRLVCSVLAGFFPVRIYMDYALTTFTDPGRPARLPRQRATSTRYATVRADLRHMFKVCDISFSLQAYRASLCLPVCVSIRYTLAPSRAKCRKGNDGGRQARTVGKQPPIVRLMGMPSGLLRRAQGQHYQRGE
ncbi:unnamed protein product, partial [Prorocentrum cordatum]